MRSAFLSLCLTVVQGDAENSIPHLSFSSPMFLECSIPIIIDAHLEDRSIDFPQLSAAHPTVAGVVLNRMDIENGEEWQNWPTAGREAHHRAQIRAWGEKKESWSGTGKHVRDIDIRHAMPRNGDELGMGVASFVDRITYRSVPLARKMVRGNRYRPLSELRKEVEIMEKLVHRHIVSSNRLKLVPNF